MNLFHTLLILSFVVSLVTTNELSVVSICEVECIEYSVRVYGLFVIRY